MLPPGPVSSLEGLSWMRKLQKDYVGTARLLHAQFGDIVHIPVLNERLCMVFSPALIRAVVVDHASELVRQERTVDVLRGIHGRSIMVSEGQEWQRQHALLRPGFSPKRVSGYAQLMVEAIRACLTTLQLSPEGLNGRVNVSALMNRLTMDVILRALFGQPAGRERDKVLDAIETLDHVIMSELFWPMTLPDFLPLPGKARKRRALNALDDLIARRIRERLRQGSQANEGSDLLAMLLTAKDEQETGGLDLQEVHDQCKVVFLAGQETTAVALTWWSWLMASNPQACQRAQEEVDSVLDRRDPCAEDLPHLPWLVATLKEAMRLYPPAPGLLTRRTQSSIEVGGFALPARSMVIPVIWSAHHDQRWFDQPEQFRPERFLPGAPPIERGAWMPFGAGPRVCIGQHFAVLEMTLMTAMLLQRFTIKVEPDQKSPEPEMKITWRPAQPLHVQLRPR